MAPKNSKITKTATVMTGVLLVLSACSNDEIIVEDDVTYEEGFTEEDFIEDEVVYEEDTYEEEFIEDEEEIAEDDYYSEDEETGIWDVDLSYYENDYPNLDLAAVEQYVEENVDEYDYDEDEMIYLLDELESEGEPTYSSYGSSFPWWLFLASSHYNYNSVKSTYGSKSNLTSSSNKNTSVSSGSKSSSYKSGFGSGSSSSSFGG